MKGFIHEHARALTYSVLLHLGIVGVMVLGMQRFVQPAAAPVKVTPVVQATVVDTAELNRQREEQERIARAQQQMKEREEQARRAREEEQARQVALRKKREEAERQARIKAEADAKRKAQETAAREKAEAERKKREAAERKKREEAERKRKAEEARKAKAEVERKAREAKQRAEAEALLRQQLEAEEARMAAERSGLLAQYVGLISQKIERNWIKPPSAKAGLECVVQVGQIPGGQVVSVRIVRCNGDDAVVRSVEAAVYRASPLPEPPDASLFERNLQLVFKPQD